VIQEHIVKGTVATTLHTFVFKQEGMQIEISPGIYWQAGKKLFEDSEGGVIPFPVFEVESRCEVWLAKKGIHVFFGDTDKWLEKDFEGDEPIDRLCWFDAPAGTSSLDSIVVNVVRMEEYVDED